MSAKKTWPPGCTRDDLRSTQSAQILEATSDQLFSSPDGLFEVEVAEVTSQATKLFSALRVFPQIYRHIGAFGAKRFPRDEGFAGFASETTVDSTGSLSLFECSYLLKYIERRDDARPGSDPWSIRHAVIYQKVSHQESKLHHILIRLPLAVKKLLGSSVLDRSGESSSFIEDWTHIHIACFSSVDHNLHQFINYLDEEIDKLFKRVIMAGVEPDKLNEFDTLSNTTNDFKALQYLLGTCKGYLGPAQRHGIDEEWGVQQDKEARVVKTLTVLAMVFVPAAFTADFIQMGFVTIKQESPMKWSADPDLKIYAILAIPLIAVTMLIYMVVELVHKAREKGAEANGQFSV
ncbi:hypothetical protein LB505_008657 [Fusarium chuoi]|nr:hypothetical protein LB505_008657 [Fusarium chuoi]